MKEKKNCKYSAKIHQVMMAYLKPVLTVLLIPMMFRSSVIALENCWKSDPESCRIEGVFQTSSSDNKIGMAIDCNANHYNPDIYNKRFKRVKNLKLNGCKSDKTVNLFKFIIDPEEVQFLTVEKFFIRNVNSSVVQLPNIKTLNWRYNVFKDILEDMFTVFINLEELSFVENIAPSLNFSIFQTLPNLKKLTIEQPTWTIQLSELLRGPSVISLQLSVDEVTTGTTAPATDYNTDSLRELIITNSSLNLESRQNARIGLLRNVKSMILKHNRITIFPFDNFNLPNLEILDLSGNLLEFIELNEFTTNSPKLKIFNISNNEIAHLLFDMGDQSINSLQILDISKNKLQNIHVLNSAHSALLSNFPIIVDTNLWSCNFLLLKKYSKILNMFKYENDFSHTNINGLSCSYKYLLHLNLSYSKKPWSITTKIPIQITSKIATERSIEAVTLDFTVQNDNEFSKVFQSISFKVSVFITTILIVFIFILYLIKQKCREQKEPFYRLVRPDLRVNNYEIVRDMSKRKLPSNGYETPLKFEETKYSKDQNENIYEEIPDNPYECI